MNPRGKGPQAANGTFRKIQALKVHEAMIKHVRNVAATEEKYAVL